MAKWQVVHLDMQDISDFHIFKLRASKNRNIDTGQVEPQKTGSYYFSSHHSYSFLTWANMSSNWMTSVLSFF